MRSGDALLQVFQCAQIFDDITAGVVKENLSVFVAPHRYQPIELVPIFEQIVDRLRHPFAWNDDDLGFQELLLMVRHSCPLAPTRRDTHTSTPPDWRETIL